MGEYGEEDRRLVAALRRGEAEAFDEVYDRWRPRVFSFLARLSGDRALAEDLVQETFLRLARRARSLHENTQLRPWLFTVSRNLFLDRRRRSVLRLERLRELALWPGAGRPAQPATPFDAAEGSEAAARIQAALLGLRPDYREAVLLCSVEGFEPTKAACVLGVSPAALRQRLARGRAMLRKSLKDES